LIRDDIQAILNDGSGIAPSNQYYAWPRKEEMINEIPFSPFYQFNYHCKCINIRSTKFGDS
jgi:hypothetical protein